VDRNLDIKNQPENTALRKTLLRAPLVFYQRLRDDLRNGSDSSPEARAKLADAYLRLSSLTGDISSLTDALHAADEAVTLFEPLVQDGPESLRQGGARAARTCLGTARGVPER
jgi:hypothetical protein